jgi:hypothetical protein
MSATSPRRRARLGFAYAGLAVLGAVTTAVGLMAGWDVSAAYLLALLEVWALAPAVSRLR